MHTTHTHAHTHERVRVDVLRVWHTCNNPFRGQHFTASSVFCSPYHFFSTEHMGCTGIIPAIGRCGPPPPTTTTTPHPLSPLPPHTRRKGVIGREGGRGREGGPPPPPSFPPSTTHTEEGSYIGGEVPLCWKLPNIQVHQGVYML